MEIKEQESLVKYNSWRVGGRAEYLCTPKSIEEVVEAEAYALNKQLPITVLGGGSNVLLPDEGIRGLVICLRKLKGQEVQKTQDRLQVLALAGESKLTVMKTFLKEKLPPAVFLSGLPGDIGGGIAMNAGVSQKWTPREFVEITDWFDVLNAGKIKRYQKNDLIWSYRKTLAWQPGIILRAQLSWPLIEANESVVREVEAWNKLRVEKQPLDKPSCGSVFVNPEGNSAGRLIEECGLKGLQIGGAQVSEKHANFIVNTGNATASDIREVIEKVQAVVKEKKSISLHTEVRFL